MPFIQRKRCLIIQGYIHYFRGWLKWMENCCICGGSLSDGQPVVVLTHNGSDSINRVSEVRWPRSSNPSWSERSSEMPPRFLWAEKVNFKDNWRTTSYRSTFCQAKIQHKRTLSFLRPTCKKWRKKKGKGRHSSENARLPRIYSSDLQRKKWWMVWNSARQTRVRSRSACSRRCLPSSMQR